MLIEIPKRRHQVRIPSQTVLSYIHEMACSDATTCYVECVHVNLMMYCLLGPDRFKANIIIHHMARGSSKGEL